MYPPVDVDRFIEDRVFFVRVRFRCKPIPLRLHYERRFFINDVAGFRHFLRGVLALCRPQGLFALFFGIRARRRVALAHAHHEAALRGRDAARAVSGGGNAPPPIVEEIQAFYDGLHLTGLTLDAALAMTERDWRRLRERAFAWRENELSAYAQRPPNDLRAWEPDDAAGVELRKYAPKVAAEGITADMFRAAATPGVAPSRARH